MIGKHGAFTARGDAVFVKLYRVLFISVILQIISSYPLNACTAFMLRQDDAIILAKNLDWLIGDGFIFINSRGTDKSAFIMNGGHQVKWRSCYGSITFNQLGKDFPIGGMNEKGLVIEALNYTPSEYPPADSASIDEFQWIQYHLDTSQSVREVLESLEKIAVSPVFIKLHYFLCDSRGETAVIEFIDREIRTYSGEQMIVPVLTNNSYENSLGYLHDHKGFGGEIIVSGGPESPVRFVRAATLIKEYLHRPDQSIVNSAFFILESVKQTDTQWSIAYNITDREIQFRTIDSQVIRSISLKEYGFEEGEMISPISSGGNEGAEPGFEKYSDRENDRMLKTVFEKLSKKGELSEASAEAFLDRLLDYNHKN
ncbi:MAG: linear amide C-N hydrolase [Candidatus Krumholzibacteriota bacterium]|nr:linear amide C-N hydrolase [Candidatus Krumholzibacteriota bacterium]